MRRGQKRIEIKESDDLCSIMEDMFHEFLESLIEKPWATRPVDEDDPGEAADAASFMYTDTAMGMIERYKDRMARLFDQYFPDEDFHIWSALYMEF
jgi:hypothetical protein